MKPKINLEIEYLRAVAVVMVIFGHITFLLPHASDQLLRIFSLYMPWSGVDLFFCVSGYVVSKSYMEIFDHYRLQGNYWIAVQSFWIRRAFRLLPSAWAWVLFGILCAMFFNSTGVFGSVFHNIRSATVILTFTGNVANQFGLLLEPNHVYWSLALEEQFYFIFPFFLLVTPLAWRWRILLGCIALLFFVDRNTFGTELSALLAAVRLDAIMWGVLIYWFTRSDVWHQFDPAFLKKHRFAALGINALLFYLLGAIPAQAMSMPMAMGMIAIISAMLVFLASYQEGYVLNLPGLSAILSWLGTRSYGLYLIHMPAYRLTVEAWTRYAQSHGETLGPAYTPQLVVTAVVVMLVLAELNFRIIEKPLRRIGARLATERLNSAIAPSAPKNKDGEAMVR